MDGCHVAGAHLEQQRLLSVHNLVDYRFPPMKNKRRVATPLCSPVMDRSAGACRLGGILVRSEGVRRRAGHGGRGGSRA